MKHPYGLEGDAWLDEIETTVHTFLTLEHARLVRVLRADFGCSWRAVASHIFYIFPEAGIANGHQLYGESLCRQAALLLNEDPSQEPWN